jgi:hypothetical protein
MEHFRENQAYYDQLLLAALEEEPTTLDQAEWASIRAEARARVQTKRRNSRCCGPDQSERSPLE